MKRLITAFACALTVASSALNAGTVVSIPITGFEDGVAPRLGGEGRQPESRIDIVSSPAHSGNKSARLHYVFKEGVTPRQYVEVALAQQIPGITKSISAWLHGDASGQQLKMRVTDAGGEIFQIGYGLIDWTGWREVIVDLTRRPEVSWGGNDDKVVDMPIKAVSYLVDSPIEPFESDLYLDDVTYTAEGEPLDFVGIEVDAPALGNAFYGRTPVINVRLRNALPKPVENIAVDLRVTSPADGTVVCELRKTVSLTAGASESFELKPQIADFGLYHAYVKLGDARQDRVAFSYLPEADVQAADPTSSFGVSMHFGHGGRGPLENNLRLAGDMGIRWLRDDATWSRIERQKGVYVVPSTFDRFLRSSRSEWGCEPMIILDYSNTLYEEDRAVATEAGRRAFAAWAEFMARTYRDSVTYWEIWNEPNISGFWKPKPNAVDYALLLKAGYEAVKRGNPDAVVVAMVTAGIDLTFIENVLKEGTVGCFDAVSVHPYRYPKSPDKAETTVEHLQRLIDLLARHGAAGTPIYNTEVGWPNQDDPRGLPEQISADYLARLYTALRSLPDIKATFWYDFQNDGLKRDYNENNFGLLHHDFTPKAPAVAYRMTSRALNGRPYLTELDIGAEAKAFMFGGPGDERLVAAWAMTGNPCCALRFADNTIREASASGPIRDRAGTDGVLTLTLGSTPVFLTGKGPVDVAPTPLTVSPSWGIHNGAATLSVTLNNPWKTPHEGRLQVSPPDGWTARPSGAFALPQGGTVTVEAIVDIPGAAEAGGENEVTFAWLNAADSVVARSVTVVKVVPTADVSLCGTRRGNAVGVAIRGTTPLVNPPGVHSVELSLPEAWGGRTQLPGDGITWSAMSAEPDTESASPPPRKVFNMTLPVSLDAVFTAPVPASVTVTFTNGATATAEREVSFWRVPVLSPGVDGDGADWETVPSVKAASFDGPGKDQCSGPDDCSLAAKVSWDQTNLYLLVDVTDDTHAQTYTGQDVWKGDGIQFAIDRQRASRPSDAPYAEFGLSLTGDGPQVFRWTDTPGLVPEATCVVMRDGTHTVYEAAIPWVLLGGRPKTGDTLGFSLLANDNDGKEREGWVPLFDGIGWRKEASKFGALMF